MIKIFNGVMNNTGGIWRNGIGRMRLINKMTG